MTGASILSYADALRTQYPASAKVFEEMAEEGMRAPPHSHRAVPERFGERIPLIRREHVREFAPRKPDWLVANMPIEKARDEAEAMENAAHHFYLEAAKRSEDAATRRLLGDLAMAEKGHETIAAG